MATTTATPAPTAIQNGGFDQGLASWTTGGVLGASWVSDGGYPSGGGAALLGSPAWNAACLGGIPVGNGYIAQTISVPNLPNPTLTFSYHIYTQDWTGSVDLSTAPPFDYFGVYALGAGMSGLNDASHLFYDGNTIQANGTGCTTPYDMGWKSSPPLSLSQFEGQTVTLYFAVWNGSDNDYNTYVYVDDVAVTLSTGTPSPSPTSTSTLTVSPTLTSTPTGTPTSTPTNSPAIHPVRTQ
jgi:hypothetical protein